MNTYICMYTSPYIYIFLISHYIYIYRFFSWLKLLIINALYLRENALKKSRFFPHCPAKSHNYTHFRQLYT